MSGLWIAPGKCQGYPENVRANPENVRLRGEDRRLFFRVRTRFLRLPSRARARLKNKEKQDKNSAGCGQLTRAVSRRQKAPAPTLRIHAPPRRFAPALGACIHARAASTGRNRQVAKRRAQERLAGSRAGRPPAARASPAGSASPVAAYARLRRARGSLGPLARHRLASSRYTAASSQSVWQESRAAELDLTRKCSTFSRRAASVTRRASTRCCERSWKPSRVRVSEHRLHARCRRRGLVRGLFHVGQLRQQPDAEHC